MMLLKRWYDFEAAEEEWSRQEEPCPTCDGKGVVVNDAGDGLATCPAADCDGGTRTRLTPPVMGIEVLRAGPKQHFSTRLVEGGQSEGWLSLDVEQLTIHSLNGPVVYHILRRPGRYGDQRIHYYDCVKEG